jgi:hypothetical protein
VYVKRLAVLEAEEAVGGGRGEDSERAQLGGEAFRYASSRGAHHPFAIPLQNQSWKLILQD